MAEIFYVYAHRRVVSGAVFYIGKGKGNRAESRKNRNKYWSNIVAKDGGRHVTFLASGLDEELAFLVEIEAIDQHRRMGCKLANLTSGGDGPSGMRHSEETKAKFRLRRASAETRLKMSGRVGPRKGVAMTAAMKTALLASHLGKPSPLRGKPLTAETKEKLKKAWEVRRLTPDSEETRRKKSKASKGRLKSDETRAKLSASKTGKKLSQESLEKRRAAIRAKSTMEYASQS